MPVQLSCISGKIWNMRTNDQTFISKNFDGFAFLWSYATIFAAKWWSNGGLEAVVSKWLAQGHKGLTAHCCSFYFAFLRQMSYFLSLTIPLSYGRGMNDLLKAQQWWVERDSNLIPPQYRPNALTTTPCSRILSSVIKKIIQSCKLTLMSCNIKQPIFFQFRIPSASSPYSLALFF